MPATNFREGLTTSAICWQTLKFSREKSPQLDKRCFLGSFYLGLLTFLLFLVPIIIFFLQPVKTVIKSKTAI